MTRYRHLGAFVLSALAITTAAAGQVPDWPSERPPRALPARNVSFPPYEFRTLPNGLQVVAVSHHEQPAVTVRLIIRAGSAQDPNDKPGVAFTVAALLDQGTTTKTAEAIANAIDSIGGAIGTGSGTELTSVTAAVMKDDLATGLALVSDVARNPAFAAEEIERQRQQTMSSLRVSYDDPDYLAGAVFDRLVFGFHPYGKPDTGTPDTLGRITRDDLVAFHKRWFGSNNAILAIVGDVAPQEAFAGAEKAFGNWAKIQLPEVKPVDPPPPTRRVVIVDRPGAVQTEIRVGNVALPRQHPDYLALDLAVKILGGEGGNRLHRVLRSERGLTYGAEADLQALKESGVIVANTDTRSVTTVEALRLIVDEMWKLQREKVQERELADAQAYLTGSFPLTIETPSAIATQVLNALFYGLNLTELQTYRERVNNVTPEDIQRVAREYLHPDKLSIVLVGDASAFAKDLPGAGFQQVERIPLAELDLNAADLRRRAGTGREPQPEPQVELENGHGPFVPEEQSSNPKALITRAVAAKGGDAKLRSIETVRMTSLVRVESAPDLAMTTYVRYPDSYRMETQTTLGPVARVCHHGDCWVKDAQGARDASAELSMEMRATIQRDTIRVLLDLLDGKLTATRQPDVTMDGRTIAAVETRGEGRAPLTLLIEPFSGAIVGQQDLLAAGLTDERYLDVRDVGGLKVAFKAIRTREGAVTVTSLVRSFEYNVPLDASLFSRQH